MKVHGGTRSILDVEGLGAAAGFDPHYLHASAA